MNLLSGKVALVTGGGSGIGRASALAFAREGAKVAIADVDVEGGKKTVNLIEGLGGLATFIKADVSKALEMEDMVKRTVEIFGKLDCALNNAGIDEGNTVPTAEQTEDNFDRTIEINLKGVWLCLKYEIKQMLIQGGGAIVNISSILGLKGGVNYGIYAASKHGVIGLTKSAAREYARFGIRINAVCPAAVSTPMLERTLGDDPLEAQYLSDKYPVGRIGSPEDIAQSVIWLCSESAAYVVGHSLLVDGGDMS